VTSLAPRAWLLIIISWFAVIFSWWIGVRILDPIFTWTYTNATGSAAANVQQTVSLGREVYLYFVIIWIVGTFLYGLIVSLKKDPQSYYGGYY